MMKLALFDLDGTITQKDTLSDFIKFAVGKPVYYFGLFKLSYILIPYLLKFMPNYIAKEKLVTYFFKGWNANKFKKISEKYALNNLDRIIKPKAIEKIRWHQSQGHKVIIVSASMECWIKAWCDKNRIELISTRLEVKNNIITGKFSTKNCYGIEKVNRIKELYNLDEYMYIFAYGDSTGDKELLALANESFYKPF